MKIMKKFINDPACCVREMLEGYVSAYGNELEIIEGYNAYKKKCISSKVVVMSNGGAGCEPMHIGYVGEGMGDATCVGEMFAAPSAYSIYETAKQTDRGKGVVLVCANFSGDRLNTDMAVELLELDGIKAEQVIVADDMTSAPEERRCDRAGAAGIIYVLKILGAASEMGLRLDELKSLADKVLKSVFTVPVVLYSGCNAETGKIMFEMPEDEFELGMGFNGEPGIFRGKMRASDEIVEMAFACFRPEAAFSPGDRYCMMVNSMGSTTYMELMIIFRELGRLLRKEGAIVYDSKINRYLTSQEMGGCSITLLKLDDELKEYYDQPAFTPIFNHKPGKWRDGICFTR